MTAADRKLLESFERALARQKLRLVYQPKVSLKDGRLTRVEALVRWDDPELGPVSPTRFVPLAEEHGLIDRLTEWGLKTTLRQWTVWRDRGLETRLAFNISAVSLERLDFPDMVERLCREMQVPTDRLVLELTEGATQQFSATATWSDGVSRAVTLAWSATGGTISSSGLYKAGLTTGTYRVIVGCNGCTVKDTASVSLTLASSSSSSLSSFTISPSSVTLDIGEVYQFSALAKKTDGTTVSASSLTWSASGGSVTSTE